jgi:putative ABC transport system permease protein
VALLIAATGLFGVISYSAVQRSREIGIRMAFGADRLQVVSMVLREGVLIAASGTALGAVAALGFSQSLNSYLYGVPSLDVPTYVAFSVLVIAQRCLQACLPLVVRHNSIPPQCCAKNRRFSRSVGLMVGSRKCNPHV